MDKYINDKNATTSQLQEANKQMQEMIAMRNGQTGGGGPVVVPVPCTIM